MHEGLKAWMRIFKHPINTFRVSILIGLFRKFKKKERFFFIFGSSGFFSNQLIDVQRNDGEVSFND